MKVSEALAARYSARAYLDKPVPTELLQELLEKAGRAPSGGNLQPWRVWALTGDVLTQFRALISERSSIAPAGEGTPYAIYPRDLKEPYRSRRFKNGEDLYRSLGIPRENKVARMRQLAKNHEFFGAPVGLIFAIDRQMQPGQWVDMGMYIQSLMLLATEHGLSTCAQESWAIWHKSIEEFLSLEPDWMVFCGMSLGYSDSSHPINRWRSDRALASEFMTVLGR